MTIAPRRPNRAVAARHRGPGPNELPQVIRPGTRPQLELLLQASNQYLNVPLRSCS